MTKGKLERQSSKYKIFHSNKMEKDHSKASEIVRVIIIEFYSKLKLIILTASTL